MKVFDGFEFWENVSRILDSKRMTNKDLAEASGTLYRTITSQRTRHQLPGAVQLMYMAQALGTSSERLLTGQETTWCQEAQAVQADSELQALVRAIMRDRRLLAVISAIVESYESKADIG